MQIIYQNKDKGNSSRETNSVDVIICVREIWKENMLEDLEEGLLEYETIEEFLADIRKKFGGGDKESVKVAELKKLEQEGKTMEEFVQEFRRAARGSGHEGRPLVEEFKRRISIIIC